MTKDNTVWVFKNGELLMANKKRGTARNFKDLASAKRFVMNLIWVSKSLTPSDFSYML